MGAFCLLLLSLQLADGHLLEGSEGEEPVIANLPPSATSMAGSSLQPTPTVRPRQSVKNSQQPVHVGGRGGSKKRHLVYTESSDEDIDMTIEDNSDSGSSVDHDKSPAKRLRSSAIVTRGSKAATSIQTITTVVGQGGHSPRVDTGVETDFDADTELAIDTDIELAIDTNIELVTDTDTEAALNTDTDPDVEAALPRSSPSGTNTNPTRRSHPDVPSRDTPIHVQQVEVVPPDADPEPSPQSPDPHSDTEPAIPDFLTTKSDIYDYLTSIDEPGFRALINNYIAFELANHSGHRGNFTTSNRPKGVGWWIDRTRPDRLPPYDSLTSFGRSIVKWWIFIQPDWRSDLKCGETLREGGCWEQLYQPGINGLLNVVILVYWWTKILKERGQPADEAYHWIVADITWVLSQLTRVASEGL